MRVAVLLLCSISRLAAQPSVSPVVTFRDEGSTVPRAINNRGEIAGHSFAPVSTQPRGFLRAADGAIRRITGPGELPFLPTGLNDRGDMVGEPAAGGGAALRSAAGAFTGIATPLAPPNTITAGGINNEGFIVGGFQPPGSSRRAYLWNLGGQLQTLADIFQGNVEGTAISNAGRILLTRPNNRPRFHVSSPRGDFPNFDFFIPGYAAEAVFLRGVNNSNLVVGEVEGRGLLVRADNPSDYVLFELPDALGTQPYAINDRDEITGSMRDLDFRLNGFVTSLCTPAVAATALEHGSAAEIGTFAVQADGFCLWSATTDTPWITMQRSLGSGAGEVRFVLAPNPGAARQGRIAIGTREVVINQAASTCTYSVREVGPLSFPAGGGALPIEVTTAPGCSWTAYSAEPWVQLSPGRGTGPGTVSAQIGQAPPSSIGRRAQIAVAGTSLALTQAMGVCEISVSRTAITASAEGGLELLRVTTPAACSWSVNTQAPWIVSLNGGFNVVGSLDLILRVDRNLSTTERSGSVTLAVQGNTTTVSVRQLPSATCGVLIPNSYRTIAGSGGGILLGATFGIGCAVTVRSEVPWIQVRNPESPEAFLQVLPNSSHLPRRGTVRAGDAVLTIDQFGNVHTQLGFVPMAPCRLLDTRPSEMFPGVAADPRPTIPQPEVPGRCPVPANVRAYVVRMIARPIGPLRALSINRQVALNDGPGVLTSMDGRTVSNVVIVPAFEFMRNLFLRATDPTFVTLDLLGYFVDPLSDGLALYPVKPCRLLDSRTDGGAFAGGTPRNLSAAGRCGVPADAAALSLNITAIPVAGPVESVTVSPAGRPRSFSPVISEAAVPTAGATLTAAGENATIVVQASHAAEVTVDVNGYFGPPSAEGLFYFPLLERCGVDSRLSPIGAAVPLTQVCPIPSEARVHALNVTALPRGPLQELEVHTAPEATGNATVRIANGQAVANLALVGDTGQGVGVAGREAADVILDVLGYFAPVPPEQRRQSLAESYTLPPREQ